VNTASIRSRLLPKSNLVKPTMCHEYLRKLLLSPPPYQVADTIHSVCASLLGVTRSLPASFERPMHASHVVQVNRPQRLNLTCRTHTSRRIPWHGISNIRECKGVSALTTGGSMSVVSACLVGRSVQSPAWPAPSELFRCV
jgi:hypothetical protein